MRSSTGAITSFPFKLILLVENPNARSRLSTIELKLLKQEFGERLWHYEGFDHSRISDLLLNAEQRETLILVSGGDGTVRRMLPFVVDTERTLGLIAKGTCNDLARALGIHRKSVRRLIACVSRQKVQYIDAFSVNDELGITVCGFGKRVTMILRAIERIRSRAGGYWWLLRLLKSHLYSLSTIVLTFVKGRMSGLNVRCEVEPFPQTKLNELYVSNQPFLARFYTIAPRARLNDGFLHLTAIRPHLFIDTIRLYLRAAVSELPQGAGIWTFSSGALDITTDTEVDFFIDGDIAFRGTHFSVHVRPRSVRILA